MDYRVDFEALPWESPMTGVRQKVVSRGDRRLRLVEFSKGFVEADWCRRGHIGYVLEGRLAIDFAGQVIEFIAGNGIFIPPGEQHRHKATILTDVVRVILVEDA